MLYFSDKIFVIQFYCVGILFHFGEMGNGNRLTKNHSFCNELSLADPLQIARDLEYYTFLFRNSWSARALSSAFCLLVLAELVKLIAGYNNRR